MWHHGQFRILLSGFLFSWMMYRQTQVSQKWIVVRGTSTSGWSTQAADFFFFFPKDGSSSAIHLKELHNVNVCNLILRQHIYTKSHTPCPRERHYHLAHSWRLTHCWDLGGGTPEATHAVYPKQQALLFYEELEQTEALNSCKYFL